MSRFISRLVERLIEGLQGRSIERYGIVEHNTEDWSVLEPDFNSPNATRSVFNNAQYPSKKEAEKSAERMRLHGPGSKASGHIKYEVVSETELNRLIAEGVVLETERSKMQKIENWLEANDEDYSAWLKTR